MVLTVNLTKVPVWQIESEPRAPAEPFSSYIAPPYSCRRGL